MLTEVLKHIEQRERFVLTSHARPDGDAIGSVLACGQILRQLGKRAHIVMRDGVPVIYQPLPFAQDVVQAQTVNGRFDGAIILECDGVQRTRLSGLDRHFLINIDHHQSGRPFAHVNWIDPSACATAEMIYRLARHAGATITPEIATCLYTAVLTDTGAFCFAGTCQRTFALAQELVRCGADPVRCAQGVYFANRTAKMRLLGAALSSLERHGELATMLVTQNDMARCAALDEDCEGLVNYAISIAGVEVAVFFRELADGRWRVSLRSKGTVNVATVAEPFGGGGHECASGFALDGPFDAARERVLAALKLV